MLHSLPIPPELAGQRLDKALSQLLPSLTRSRIQQLLAEGAVERDGQTEGNASRKVKAGETYRLREPEPEPLDLQPLAMPLDIIYEDDQLLVVNKPAGLTVHPAAGNRTHTLVNALLAHCGDSLSGIGGVARPGIVHRIDKDTSGLLVVAKTDHAHQALSGQLKSRALKRQYVAYVWHQPPRREGIIDAPIARHPTKRKEMAIVEGGRHAVTHYSVERIYSSPRRGEDGRGASTADKNVSAQLGPHPNPWTRNNDGYPSLFRAPSPVGEGVAHPTGAGYATKLRCDLDTGRTHQIRIHMKHLGCPMIGDPVYGLSPKQTLNIIHKAGIISGSETEKIVISLSRQALHARMLRLIHPVTGAEMQFDAPEPDDLKALDAALELS